MACPLSLVGREAAARLGVARGIVDLSLAPTPAVGDSVAEILEIMGVDACGGPGSTMALSLLTGVAFGIVPAPDRMKKSPL